MFKLKLLHCMVNIAHQSMLKLKLLHREVGYCLLAGADHKCIVTANLILVVAYLHLNRML